jgi:hypothetical protein
VVLSYSGAALRVNGGRVPMYRYYRGPIPRHRFVVGMLSRC